MLLLYFIYPAKVNPEAFEPDPHTFDDRLYSHYTPSTMSYVPHPLSDLSIEESTLARDVVLKLHESNLLDFRAIYLLEPDKKDVLRYLELERAGRVNAATLRPPRLAQVKYDVIGGSKATQYHESIVNVSTFEVVRHTIVGQEHHASLSM